jgi:hypothetical protein
VRVFLGVGWNAGTPRVGVVKIVEFGVGVEVGVGVGDSITDEFGFGREVVGFSASAEENSDAKVARFVLSNTRSELKRLRAVLVMPGIIGT